MQSCDDFALIPIAKWFVTAKLMDFNYGYLLAEEMRLQEALIGLFVVLSVWFRAQNYTLIHIDGVVAQFATQALLATFQAAVYKGEECSRVVVMHRMAEFVDYNVVAQVLG